jgi:pimeloyl-ACP methyl ester carboxylesterase
MDTRGHGRSTDDAQVPFTYDLFADDVVALLDHLNVAAANFVGWSDGANTCLSLAMRYGSRVKRIFAFGPNFQPDQAIPYEPGRVPFVSDLMSRMKEEYQSISPTPERFNDFMSKMEALQTSYPAWTEEHFSKITSAYKSPDNGFLVWIVTADSEELIQHWVAKAITDMIDGSTLLVLPDVSHFAPLQGVESFNNALDDWLSST